jgi:hypothetical protein
VEATQVRLWPETLTLRHNDALQKAQGKRVMDICKLATISTLDFIRQKLRKIYGLSLTLSIDYVFSIAERGLLILNGSQEQLKVR